jgi:hypothetical protein
MTLRIEVLSLCFTQRADHSKPFPFALGITPSCTKIKTRNNNSINQLINPAQPKMAKKQKKQCAAWRSSLEKDQAALGVPLPVLSLVGDRLEGFSSSVASLSGGSARRSIHSNTFSLWCASISLSPPLGDSMRYP